MAINKKRLDQLVSDHVPEHSRQLIQSWIMQGKIKVDGKVVTKPGVIIAQDAILEMDIAEPKYVGRAGFKLEKALDSFGIDVQGLVALDAGLSTGGFTDCLLQRGIKKVYGVDVGYGQVHEKIRADNRVVVLERTNLRHVSTVGELVDLVTLDLSFISLLKVMDAINGLIKRNGQLIVLIKPQFEAGKSNISRGGIVKDPAVHAQVIESVTKGIMTYGYTLIGTIESPIEGMSGNKEFLAYFKKMDSTHQVA